MLTLSFPVPARFSQPAVAGFLAVLLSCARAAAQCGTPIDFEDPPYTGSAAGTIMTGQPATCPVANQWYIPVAGSLNQFVHTYAGNTLGLGTNPFGGLQFCGAPSGTNFARAQIAHDFSAGGVWKVQYDCTARMIAGAPLPAGDNIGSWSLQPSPTTRFFQTLLNWGVGGGTYDGPNSPPPNNTATGTAFHIHIGHFNVTTPGSGGLGTIFSVPGPEFLNLDVTHWYRVTAEWDFTAAQILRVSIKDLTANTATVTYDVYALGWLLQGGLNSTLPLPTDHRVFTGGATGAGTNITGWDNIQLTQVPAAELGACCDTITGHCGLSFPTGCTAPTQVYSGLGSDCTIPCVAVQAACCDPTGGCTTTTFGNCSGGNLWRGAGATCAQCVADCNPGPAASCQSRGNLNAYASDSTASRAAENFIPSQNSITGGCVSGTYSTLFPPMPASHFRVKYYANSPTGLPGAQIASFEEGVNLTVTGPAATGDALPAAAGSLPILSWRFAHASVTVTPGVCHWIEITNETTRQWFWDMSGEGEGYFVQDTTPATPYSAADIVGLAGTNLSFCITNVANNQTLNLTGLNSCVVGSCCFNVCPFTCLTNVSQSACNSAATAAGGTATWTAGGSCLTSCSQIPQFCCRGDYSANLALNGRDLQGMVQAMLAPPNCAVNPTAFCLLNINEDFQINANANPSPNDVKAMVDLLLAGGESPDRICGALLVSSNSATVLDNSNATSSIYDPELSLCVPIIDPPNNKGEGSMWLRFVATDTTARVDTELTSQTPIPPQIVVDSILAVYHSPDGTASAALPNQIACDDDSGVGILSLINLTGLTVGETYFVELMTFPGQGSRGIYTVRVTSPSP